MDITILSEKDNPLLKRKEILARVSHRGATPQFKTLLPELQKTLKAPDDTVILQKIFTRKGEAVCDAKVFVYTSKDHVPKDKLERQQRKLAGEKKQKKEKAAPTKKEEKKK